MPKYITGYYISFKGRPESRRASIRVSVDVGIAAMQQWEEGKATLMVKGAAYSFSSIDAIEPIRTQGELDEQRALQSGTAVTEEQLRQKIEDRTKTEYLPALTEGGEST